MATRDEFACIHMFPCLRDFTYGPCQKCGAIHEHIAMVDALEDAAICAEKAKGWEVEAARQDRIDARAKILDALRLAAKLPVVSP